MEEIYGKTVFRIRSVAVITWDCLMHKQKLLFLKAFYHKIERCCLETQTFFISRG